MLQDLFSYHIVYFINRKLSKNSQENIDIAREESITTYLAHIDPNFYSCNAQYLR